jgi:hypothetical protein
MHVAWLPPPCDARRTRHAHGARTVSSATSLSRAALYTRCGTDTLAPMAAVVLLWCARTRSGMAAVGLAAAAMSAPRAAALVACHLLLCAGACVCSFQDCRCALCLLRHHVAGADIMASKMRTIVGLGKAEGSRQQVTS